MSFFIRIAVILGTLLVTQSCVCYALLAPLLQASKCPVSYQDDRYRDYGLDLVSYTVPRNLSKSPLGVPIGPGVDGAKVDASFTKVAKCMGVKFHPCGVKAVLIAPDWFVAPGTERQVFPCKYPDPNVKLCTGVNQWPAIVYITPDMYAMDWEANRMLLRDDPSNDPRRCWQAP